MTNISRPLLSTKLSWISRIVISIESYPKMMKTTDLFFTCIYVDPCSSVRFDSYIETNSVDDI